MQHDRPSGSNDDADPRDISGMAGNSAARDPEITEEQARQVRFLEEEVALLRRRTAGAPKSDRVLDQRLAEASERISQLTERNNKLVETLREARGQLLALREEVDRLAQPPSGYGVFLSAFEDNTVDVFTSGRKMRVSVSPSVEIESLRRGQALRLNEALTVVEGGDFESTGEVCALREVLEPEFRRRGTRVP
jgi:ATP-dependent 26S proteasome regulatory subunit